MIQSVHNAFPSFFTSHTIIEDVQGHITPLTVNWGTQNNCQQHLHLTLLMCTSFYCNPSETVEVHVTPQTFGSRPDNRPPDQSINQPATLGLLHPNRRLYWLEASAITTQAARQAQCSLKSISSVSLPKWG